MSGISVARCEFCGELRNVNSLNAFRMIDGKLTPVDLCGKSPIAVKCICTYCLLQLPADAALVAAAEQASRYITGLGMAMDNDELSEAMKVVDVLSAALAKE